MNTELSEMLKSVNKTVNSLASLYFIRNKKDHDEYWYIVAQTDAGQEISTKTGYKGAGMWTKDSADFLLAEYGLLDDWEAVPVLEVAGNIDGSVN